MINLMTLIEAKLDELMVKDMSGKDTAEKFILAFRQHLFIMDRNNEVIKKVRIALSKHPAIGRRKFTGDKDRDSEQDSFDFLYRAAESAADILVGEWYPPEKKLVVWDAQEIIPLTSLQVKKVAKQLGAETVTYRYVDYAGGDEDANRDISAKKLIGGAPKIMYHGTSTKELKDLLKYGLDPGRGRSRFGKRGIFHPEHIFMEATLEAAMFYADNAVDIDKSEKSGWDSFPIVIEFQVPDSDLLVPDFDADVTSGAKPYYHHSNEPHNKTMMKAMGVSRETGKWGYKGRVPSSFFRWIYYYNPYHKKWHKSRPDTWRNLLWNYDMETISWKIGLQGYKEDQPKYRQYWQQVFLIQLSKRLPIYRYDRMG